MIIFFFCIYFLIVKIFCCFCNLLCKCLFFVIVNKWLYSCSNFVLIVVVSFFGIFNSKIILILFFGVISDFLKILIDKIIVGKVWLIVWGKVIFDLKIVVCWFFLVKICLINWGFINFFVFKLVIIFWIFVW